MANKVTLEEILQTLKEYKVDAEIPTFFNQVANNPQLTYEKAE